MKYLQKTHLLLRLRKFDTQFEAQKDAYGMSGHTKLNTNRDVLTVTCLQLLLHCVNSGHSISGRLLEVIYNSH